ncbi:MAG: Trk system potassium transporter TrkA, partial [Fusobacterium sp.]|nr:Trk system potassium transporter TrkA [Fusobacterium sp.]
GNDITLIETNAKILDKLISNNDIMGFVGNGTTYDVQMEAGVPKADIFIAVTEKDEINIISSVIAKKLGAKFTIARVRSTEYSSQITFMSESLGIDLVINPELETAKYIKQNIDFPDALNVESFLNGQLKMVEFLIDEDSRLSHISISDFKQKLFPDLLVCIIKRENEIIIPSGNSVLKAGDRIYVTGTKQNIIKFQNALGKHTKKITSTFIIGAGIITYYLAEELVKEKIKVKILESNEEKAIKFCEYLPEATIVNADGSNEEILKEENFKNYDACISITGMDETNIFISMYAKKLGIKKIITKLNKLSFLDILGENSFQSIVTPKKLIADNIIRVVRSLASKRGNKIENLYRLENNRIEAIEFLINSHSKVNDTPLKNLKIKKNLLIAYIVRNNIPIFPSGNDIIKEGDRVIIITTENFFDDINDILDN